MSALRSLRVVAFWEGISFLVLLGVAMPLKYLFQMPLAVRIVGMAHGVLFVAFLACLAWAATARSWGVGRCAAAFFASIVPGGTFWLERSLRREMDAVASPTAPG